MVALGEEGQLRELSNLTGRLRDSLRNGIPDQEVQDQMKLLADILPAKYRVMGLLKAALQTGEQGQRLAELHLERSYKLFHEDYLDLERIDREIQSISE